MRMPGFTAELATGRTSGQYRFTRTGAGARRAVSAQLGGRVFGGRVGRLGTLGDYWPCRDACYRTYSSCLDTCEGTLANPQGSSHCIICDDNYQRCLSGCTGDIA